MAELEEFLIGPAQALKLRARVHGVHYPVEGQERLAGAGIEHGGWIPNFALPGVFARFRLTIHIPRRETLPEFPPFRSSRPSPAGFRWSLPLGGSGGAPGADYLVARDGLEMRRALRALMTDEGAARALAEHGRRTILARHTCVHRVNELLGIVTELNRSRRRPAVAHAG